MSDDGMPGVAMVVALIVGLASVALLCARLLLWALAAAMVVVQA